MPKLLSFIGSLLAIYMVVTPCIVTGQTNSSSTDSIAVSRILNRSSQYFDRSAYDSALAVCEQALAYSKTHNYPAGQALSYIKMNDILIEKDDLAKAEETIPLLYRIGQQLKDSGIIATSFLHKAQVRLYREQLDSAIYNFERSLSYFSGRKPGLYTALAYNDMGYTWGRKGEFGKFIEFCLKALTIYEAIDNPEGAAMSLGNVSTAYYDLGQKDKAIEYAKRSLVFREKIGDINKLALSCCNLSQMYLGQNLEEASKYQQLCVKYAKQTGIESRIIQSYTTSSLVANAMKDNERAFGYELQAIELLEKSHSDLPMLARRYIAAAFYNDMLKKDSTVTLDYFNKSVKLSQELNSKLNLRDLYLYMSNFYSKHKGFEEAYSYYKKYIVYRDSVLSAEKQENIDELEKKYQTEKKDIEIGKLQAEQKIRQLEIEKQKAIINGNLLEAKQKENEINLLQQERQLQDLKLQQQGEEILRQKLEAKNKEQELQLAQSEKQLNEKGLQNQKQLRNGIIALALLLALAGAFAFSRYQLKRKLEQQAVLQDMRNNIASDLHDDVGASLSNINILNELTRRNADNPAKVQEYLTKASDDIKQVSEGISDIVWNINPRYDNLEHLFIRMKRYASDILDGKNIGYEIHFPEQTGDWKLEMDKRRDLYLIFKEGVNNLAKYSSAQKAIIELSIQGNQLQLKIEDDGIGFEPGSKNSGNGLQNMKQRAALLQGQLVLDSSPGNGTRLLLLMPV